jgi:hypothetical protein
VRRILGRMSGTGALAVACSALISVSGAEPSSKAANDLVALMKARHLDAVAIEDPRTPERFIAAMLIPDVQLLVVGAKTTASAYLRAQIAAQQYRDAYSSINSYAVST